MVVSSFSSLLSSRVGSLLATRWGSGSVVSLLSFFLPTQLRRDELSDGRPGVGRVDLGWEGLRRRWLQIGPRRQLGEFASQAARYLGKGEGMDMGERERRVCLGGSRLGIRKTALGGGGRSLALLCWLSREQVLEILSFRELGGGEVGGFSSLSQVRKKKPQLSGVSEC